MTHTHNTAIVFAGGKSSRMGQDKALMPFGDSPTLCEYQYTRLKTFFDTVYISTKEAKFAFDAELIYDKYPQSSPLVGIVSIFETIEAEECFILSVDAPFVSQEIINKLYKESKKGNFDAIIAQSPRGKEPLCGIYRRSIVAKAKKFLAEDNHRLHALLSASNSVFIKFENSSAFDNLNHIEEYNKAIEKIEEK